MPCPHRLGAFPCVWPGPHDGPALQRPCRFYDQIHDGDLLPDLTLGVNPDGIQAGDIGGRGRYVTRQEFELLLWEFRLHPDHQYPHIITWGVRRKTLHGAIRAFESKGGVLGVWGIALGSTAQAEHGQEWAHFQEWLAVTGLGAGPTGTTSWARLDTLPEE